MTDATETSLERADDAATLLHRTDEKAGLAATVQVECASAICNELAALRAAIVQTPSQADVIELFK